MTVATAMRRTAATRSTTTCSRPARVYARLNDTTDADMRELLESCVKAFSANFEWSSQRRGRAPTPTQADDISDVCDMTIDSDSRECLRIALNEAHAEADPAKKEAMAAVAMRKHIPHSRGGRASTADVGAGKGGARAAP